ncbi:MAG: S-layer protein domain-containing protein [Candidatus Methanoperedens sp.]|nr:S-layer protein domain-containing protein [Candidatus Methanoperedens sp.]MCZ7395310.1 S-layer protein domain-containing protein [Candidatus Methanoperedens sp.]
MKEDAVKKEPSKIRSIIIYAAFIIIGISAYWITRPPLLSLYPDPPSLNFDLTSGMDSGYQTLSVSNSGGGHLSWSVSTDEPSWIRIYPEKGTDSGTVSLYINTANLNPGKYKGTITVTSNGGVKTGNVYIYLATAPAQTVEGTGTEARETLSVGETWNIGDGWSVQANAIDAKATPKQIWLTLYRNETELDDRILSEGETYNYNNIFSVKIASIYAGAVTDMATLSDVIYHKGQ